MLLEMLKGSPFIFAGTVLLPVLAGLITAFAGYQSLHKQIESAHQSDRMEEGINEIRGDKTAFANTLDLLKSFNAKLESAGARDEVLVAVMSQYERLISSAEKIGHPEDKQDVTNAFLDILTNEILPVKINENIPGEPLRIQLGQNTFRFIFPVPMRVPPTLKFVGLPENVHPEVSNLSKIGFTVTLYPIDAQIGNFRVLASAEL